MIDGDVSRDDTGRDLTMERYEVGRDLLGPIFVHYLSLLDHTIRSFSEQRQAKVVFVARAGVRLHRLYRSYLERQGLEADASIDIFWCSRVLALKGTWAERPQGAEEHLARLFRDTSLAEVVRAMFAPFEPPSAVRSRSLAKRSGATFPSFIHGRSRLARQTREHLREVGTDFRDFVAAMLGDHRTVLLVDSGWQGTTQTLLTAWRPGIEWYGAYFGVFGSTDSDRRFWDRMRGLMFQADRFDPSVPATSMTLHRHLIEDLLEPIGPSIELLERRADGSVHAPAASVLLADAPGLVDDPMFCGVHDHVRSMVPGPGPARQASEAGAALQELARRLAFPTPEDALVLGGQRRSHDLGRSGEASVLVTSADGPGLASAEDRIAHSLWPPGQAALEYGDGVAAQRQRLLTGTAAASVIGSVPAAKPVDPHAAPLVAVVTRTRDRPAFLERAMRSVAAQSMSDFEHVVICDGGDIDRVAAIVWTSPADPRRTRIVDTRVNRGMEAASNIAIRNSSSRFIVIHDDDDTWEPSFLERATAFLTAAEGARYEGVVTASWRVSEEVTADGIRVRGKAPYQAQVNRIELAEMAAGNLFPPIAFVFSRQAYEAVGGFDETLPVLGDWDFNLRFLARHDIGMIPDRLANYHVRDVGERQLYGNTTSAGIRKHIEFTAVVRNRYLRGPVGHEGSLATVVGLGYGLSRLRTDLRRGDPMETQAHDSADVDVDRDLRWATLTSIGGRRLGPLLAARWPRRWHHLVASPLLAKVLIRSGLRRTLPGPPDFDERAYLSANPDVAAAVKDGHYPSGFAHHVLHGHEEHRVRPTLDRSGDH
jgi:glycosyltransferase involved in cell wall biosynthesis